MDKRVMGEECPNRIKEFGYLTIKERLLLRFIKARNIAGLHWRSELAKHDPFFNTSEGNSYTVTTAQAVSDSSRGNVDRIERMVVALEKVVGIEVRSVV